MSTFSETGGGEHLDQIAPSLDWIWTGFISPGSITLLTGQWTHGKTTLLSHLLAHRLTATPLLDFPVRSGGTVVVSEETASAWRLRKEKLPFGDEVRFFFKPFPGARPTPEQIEALVEHLLKLRQARGIDLAVFDSVSKMLPIRCENSPDAVNLALKPLERLTGAGMGVLLLHHPRKGRILLGQAARGTGALSASTFIQLELHTLGNPSSADRRRLLLGFAHNDFTPPSLVIELNAAGTEYTILPEEPDSEFPEFWFTLKIVLEEARAPLSRLQILDRWPKDTPKPSLRNLWNWLNHASAKTLVARVGTGYATRPFQYYLSCKLAEWLKDDIWCMVHQSSYPELSIEIPEIEPVHRPPVAASVPVAGPPCDEAPPPATEPPLAPPAVSTSGPSAPSEDKPADLPAPAADPPLDNWTRFCRTWAAEHPD